MRRCWIISCLIILTIPTFVESQEADGNINNLDYFNEQLLLKVEENDSAAVRRLLNEGAIVNIKTYEGVTPLMYSVVYGYYGIARLLIMFGADVNITPYDGRTPLMEAASQGNIEIGELLIENNAMIEEWDKEGNAAIHYSILNDQFYFTDMLLYYGANPELKTKNGDSPLVLASYIGDADIIYILLDAGADINSQDKQGFTALMIASQQGYTDVVDFLIQKGADINTVNQNGVSALALAVKNGYNDIVNLLIERGADYRISFKGGYNFINIAEKNNHYDIKKTLKQKGLTKNNIFFIDRIYLNSGIFFNGQNAFWRYRAGVIESRLRSGVVLSYSKRFISVPVLEFENSITYQYYENRSYIGFEIFKQFSLYEISNIRNTGIVVSLGGLYSYGKYRSVVKKPLSYLTLSPEVGFYYRYGGFSTSLSYKFLRSGYNEINSSLFNIDISVDFRFKKQNIKEKTIEW